MEARAAHTQREDFSKIHFAAVLVFHDSRAWGRDIQYMLDVLRSDNGVFGTALTNEQLQKRPQIPLYFSHGDVCKYARHNNGELTSVWGNNHCVARLGQGAFRIAFEAVYEVCLVGRMLADLCVGGDGEAP